MTTMQAKTMGRRWIAGVCGLAALAAQAGPLVYTPVNPAFGGSPLNGSVLLNEAQAINQTKAPTDPDAALKAFNTRLQSALLSRLTTAMLRNVTNANGDLQPGTVDTTNFTVTVEQIEPGVLQLTTVSKLTGASQSFVFNQSDLTDDMTQ